MLRVLLILFAIMAWGCVLDRGEDRRPEILPGRYRASGDSDMVEYDFHADGSFSFVRTEAWKITITETGRWDYRYDGPDKRYLIESEVTRRDLGDDNTWFERQNLGFQYRIKASSSNEFHLDPGYQEGTGAIGLFSLLFGSGDVVFHRL